MAETRRFRVVETFVHYVDTKDSDAAADRVACRAPKHSEYYMHVFPNGREEQ